MTNILLNKTRAKGIALAVYRAIGGFSMSRSYDFDFNTSSMWSALSTSAEVPVNNLAARAVLMIARDYADNEGSRYVASLRADLEDEYASARHIGTISDVAFYAFPNEAEARAGYSERTAYVAIRNDFLPVVSEDVDGDTSDLVTTVSGNLRVTRPSQELLDTLPERARPFAVRVDLVGDSDTPIAIRFTETGHTVESAVEAHTSVNAQELLAQGRNSYREWLRGTMGRGMIHVEDREAVEKRRSEAAVRFAAFVRRESDETRHVPTLPFVPNGLSSSRRWGIEVESGGARGVGAPEHWDRKYDGSLRSAWDGYREVQDFEPFDEEVTEFIRPARCVNSARHEFEIETWNSAREEYEYTENENYLPPNMCQECGSTTRVVHRVPGTIVHRASSDDCAEFVSPILVSMHSKGLKEITEKLILQPQNQSAGVHVHVEASDLTPEQVATLIFGYDVLEPILEASYQREARRYCQRREVSSVLEMARKLRPGGKVTQDEVRRGDRYVTLNTTALSSHGTIEFRAMGPVYDYDYLVRWAMLCRELVNVVAAGVTTKRFSQIKSWDDLTMLLAEYGKEYMRAVVYEKTGDTGHAADLEKRGQTITAEALEADLNTWAADSSLWARGATFARGIMVDEAVLSQLSARLVTVGSSVTAGLLWNA